MCTFKPLLLGLLLACAALPAAAAPALFGSRESVSSDLRPFPKWTGMLARLRGEQDIQCESGKRCALKEWRDFLKTLEGQDLTSQVEAVNTHMNAADYILDPVNWGVDDYWATPLQFFFKDGDCEDYAISKYLSLRALGVPPKQLRVVILQDLNLGVLHAVLAVYQGDRISILDNQVPRVVQAANIRHYVPIYSINEEAWWRHRM